MKLLSITFFGIIFAVSVLDGNANPLIHKPATCKCLHSTTSVSSRSELTAQDKKLVKTTWARLYKDPIKIGVAIMFGYLQRYPRYLDHFKKFADVPIDDLQSNKKFQVHCRYIAGGVNAVVESVNDPEKLKHSLVEIVKGHRDHGETSEQFKQLQVVMLDVLKQQLGTSYTPKVEKAWVKTINAAFTGFLQVFQKNAQ